jgi:hypothetical protein
MMELPEALNIARQIEKNGGTGAFFGGSIYYCERCQRL